MSRATRSRAWTWIGAWARQRRPRPATNGDVVAGWRSAACSASGNCARITLCRCSCLTAGLCRRRSRRRRSAEGAARCAAGSVAAVASSVPTRAGAARRKREDARREAERLLENRDEAGRVPPDSWNRAIQCLRSATDVTPEMCRRVIAAARKQTIECLVAPYEADAQLAYLCRIKYVDAVLTEDSDLLMFGCPLVLVKLSGEGDVDEFRLDRLPLMANDHPGTQPQWWTLQTLRRIGILSGCDYLDSPHGVGLKTAMKLLREHCTIENVIRHLRRSPKWCIGETYEHDFQRAELTFLHQRVYCPHAQRLVPLEPFPDERYSQLCCIGPYVGRRVRTTRAATPHPPTQPARLTRTRRHNSDMPAEEAQEIARGLRDPTTRQPVHAAPALRTPTLAARPARPVAPASEPHAVRRQSAPQRQACWPATVGHDRGAPVSRTGLSGDGPSSSAASLGQPDGSHLLRREGSEHRRALDTPSASGAGSPDGAQIAPACSLADDQSRSSGHFRQPTAGLYAGNAAPHGSGPHSGGRLSHARRLTLPLQPQLRTDRTMPAVNSSEAFRRQLQRFQYRHAYDSADCAAMPIDCDAEAGMRDA